MTTLDFDAPPAEPLGWIQIWIDDAVAAGCREPGAMTLATVDAQGRPSARVVLFKGLVDGSIRFYTNSRSRKGAELREGAPVALCFWWDQLYRQLRVEGPCHPLPGEVTDAYFASRPHGSQVSAWASAQSESIASREALEGAFADAEQRFAGREVPRPPHWWGYRVEPLRVEFWQGQSNRLHDRLQYDLGASGWSSARLQP